MDRDELLLKIRECRGVLEGGLQPLVTMLAEQLTAEESLTNQHLTPHQNIQQHFEGKIAHELTDILERLQAGLFALITKLAEDALPKGVCDDCSKVLQRAQANLEDPKRFLKAVLYPKSVQDVVGVTEETLEILYGAACKLLDDEKYDQAADAFYFLTVLDSRRFAFWYSLGLSQLGQQHYKEALFAFKQASHLDPQDHLTYVYMYGCHEALDERDNALSCLNSALMRINARPECKELQNMLEDAKRFLLRRH